METSVIVMAWLGGILSGTTVAIGAVGLITGRVLLNPSRIDWSVAEGRALGAISTVMGVYLAVVTLVFAVRFAAGGSPALWFLPAMVIVPFAASSVIWAVGRRHDVRNPAKKYWR